VKLRLFHHHDGARVAYREAGTGPGLVLLHSMFLSHREWEPIAEHLTDRFRVILPDLPLHGDSEDRPRHPYTLEWLAEVMAAFCVETAGPRPLVGGHDLGAEILLRAVEGGLLEPSKLVLTPNCLHRPPARAGLRSAWRTTTRAAAVPGLDRLLSHGAQRLFQPDVGVRLSARGNPEARDLVRHAFADVGGNANLARSWAIYARHRELRARRELLDAYAHITAPTLLLWADEDPLHPLQAAEEALDLLPDAQLRVLSGTGFLMTYDDPVGVGRELAAFCG
jgi:pimeloyl-ACP methyl ester carboxylesterase